jgi:hypothetical protein
MENVMFEKIPYGVKVRVRGNEQDGFIAEYAICCSRFLPFFDSWNIIRHYPSGNYSYSTDTFPTLELAKEAAMTKYDNWIVHFKREEETKRIAKAQRKIVWKHP